MILISKCFSFVLSLIEIAQYKRFDTKSIRFLFDKKINFIIYYLLKIILHLRIFKLTNYDHVSSNCPDG